MQNNIKKSWKNTRASVREIKSILGKKNFGWRNPTPP